MELHLLSEFPWQTAPIRIGLKSVHYSIYNFAINSGVPIQDARYGPVHECQGFGDHGNLMLEFEPTNLGRLLRRYSARLSAVTTMIAIGGLHLSLSMRTRRSDGEPLMRAISGRTRKWCFGTCSKTF